MKLKNFVLLCENVVRNLYGRLKDAEAVASRWPIKIPFEQKFAKTQSATSAREFNKIFQDSIAGHTAQKTKFSIMDFFSKCDHICRKLLLKVTEGIATNL